MTYKVKLDVFEGPFDLLVYLIEHARMSIYDIRVSEITTQYLSYIRDMKRQDVTVAQEFMVLAAALIELKAKMLLPGSEEEEIPEGEEDPRSELVARLLEYKRFKEMAEFFAQQEEISTHIHTKPREDLDPYTGPEEELLRTDIEQFARAFRAFLFRKKKLEEIRQDYERVERQRMSIEHKIEQIRSFFRRKPKLRFSELIARESDRYDVVLTFVSVLELVKQAAVRVRQPKQFGDIEIVLKGDRSQGS
ncbi:MAG: segregation/condensation protein A [Anaerovoracaceae bacterium]|jgi:segregation and condensation protein A|nr:segregation/condensation protein A [Clostridiales bacterium]